MEVREHAGQILFLHRVVQGASDRSYGVHVAELAGVPAAVLRRARELLAAREVKATARPAARAAVAGAMDVEPPLGAQLPLFGPHSAAERTVLERLAALEPETMRPIEALALLSELVDRLRATPRR
jgi:DNA mismatch repair protein MutS